MSNNRNNNRRRGRGNNRSQGGNQLNRIDSRARGNAPQMLEKYRKLAHDASLNGDRVQAEYYLQFADHYFRVIADSRVQKDDPRGPRRDSEREQSDEDEDFEDEFSRGQRQTPQIRREDPAPEGSEGADAKSGGSSRKPEQASDDAEPAENPFTRPNRSKPRRPRKESAGGPAERSEADRDDGDSDGRLDPSALPGAIGADSSDEEPKEKPAKPLRARRPRARGKDDEELEAVS